MRVFDNRISFQNPGKIVVDMTHLRDRYQSAPRNPSLLDDTMRKPHENPSIGIILCAEKDHVDVELALEGVTKPIGVADYQLLLPKKELAKIIQDEMNLYIKDSHAEKD